MADKKERNVKARPRPTSPHLQIYKPQITSMLSITHRASIVALYIGVLGLIYLIFMNSFGYECLCMNWFNTDETGTLIRDVILAGYAFIGSYWVFATIRHFFWDIGKGYELPTVYKTAKIAILATILLTILIISIALNLI